jgi:hypothetical protein
VICAVDDIGDTTSINLQIIRLSIGCMSGRQQTTRKHRRRVFTTQLHGDRSETVVRSPFFQGNGVLSLTGQTVFCEVADKAGLAFVPSRYEIRARCRLSSASSRKKTAVIRHTVKMTDASDLDERLGECDTGWTMACNGSPSEYYSA